MQRQAMCRHNAWSGGNASSRVIRVVRQCVETMRRQGVMRRQAMCRHNASSGGTGIIGNLSLQYVASVSAKSHTQAADALLFIYIYIIKTHNHICIYNIFICIL